MLAFACVMGVTGEVRVAAFQPMDHARFHQRFDRAINAHGGKPCPSLCQPVDDVVGSHRVMGGGNFCEDAQTQVGQAQAAGLKGITRPP